MRGEILRYRTAATLALFVLISCGGETPAPLATEPVSGGTLVRRMESDLNTLNFVVSNTVYEKYVLSLVHDSIVDWDDHLGLIPGLATEWRIEDGGRKYVFTLDSRATFSDGTPVRASDVIFTLRKIVDPESQSVQFAGLFDGLDLEETRAIDDHQFVVAFKEARAGQLASFNIPVLPEHIYAAGSFRDDFNQKVVGSGPYRLLRWDPGQEVVLERRKNYWRKSPHIDQVRFKIIADDNVAWNAMKRGEIHEMKVKSDIWWSEKDSPAVKNTMEIHQFYELAYNFIAWNQKSPILSDRRVRVALAHCLDRNSIVDNLYHKTARLITGPFTPDQWAYDPEIAPIPFDIESARTLLEEAGWKDPQGDGILERDGKDLRIEVLVSSGSLVSSQIGQILQDSAKRAGIEIELTRLESATFFEKIITGDYEGAILGIGIDPDPDPFSLFHSSQFPPAGQNFVHYSNSDVDRLIEEGRVELDHERRVEIYRKLHRILHDDQPYTWIVQAASKWGVSRTVQGVRVADGFGLFLWNPGSRAWWIEGASPEGGE